MKKNIKSQIMILNIFRKNNMPMHKVKLTVNLLLFRLCPSNDSSFDENYGLVW